MDNILFKDYLSSYRKNFAEKDGCVLNIIGKSDAYLENLSFMENNSTK